MSIIGCCVISLEDESFFPYVINNFFFVVVESLLRSFYCVNVCVCVCVYRPTFNSASLCRITENIWRNVYLGKSLVRQLKQIVERTSDKVAYTVILYIISTDILASFSKVFSKVVQWKWYRRSLKSVFIWRCFSHSDYSGTFKVWVFLSISLVGKYKDFSFSLICRKW